MTLKKQLLRRIEALEARVERLTEVARASSHVSPVRTSGVSGPAVVHVEPMLSDKAVERLHTEREKFAKLMRQS